MLKRILKGIHNAYLRKTNPIKWARHLGITIGDNCSISPEVHFPTEPYLVTIGNNCAITSNVYIHTHGGGRVVRTQIPDFDCFGKVVIQDWAYIGTGAQIMPGVTVGEGALVAAGSIVTKSVAPRTVVGGNPARYLCTVDEYISRNKGYNVNTKSMGAIEKREYLLSLQEEKFIKK